MRFQGCFPESGIYNRHNILHMGPAGQLRYNATIFLVDLLGGNDVGNNNAIGTNRCAGFIA
jgi:hypothetical protein